MLKVVLNAQNTNQSPFCKCMISSCDCGLIGTLFILSALFVKKKCHS